jgi:hypothetical protein
MTPIPLGILALSGVFASGAFDLLETTTLTSSAASISFTGLGSYATAGYKHLQIRMIARNDNRTGLRLKFNSDSGTNYAYHNLAGNGSVVSSGSATSEAFIDLATYPTSTQTVGNYGAVVCDVYDFASTVKNTTTRTLSGVADTSFNHIRLMSGLWNSLAAVTEISLGHNGTLLAGTRISIYGVK